LTYHQPTPFLPRFFSLAKVGCAVPPFSSLWTTPIAPENLKGSITHSRIVCCLASAIDSWVDGRVKRVSPPFFKPGVLPCFLRGTFFHVPPFPGLSSTFLLLASDRALSPLPPPRHDMRLEVLDKNSLPTLKSFLEGRLSPPFFL